MSIHWGKRSERFWPMKREVVFVLLQAEDGIRDYKVTGVQTCALPISSPEAPASYTQRQDLLRGVRAWVGSLEDRGSGSVWRLCLRLGEPIDLEGLRDFESPGRSEERRVGKESRSRWSPYHLKQKR